MGVPYATSCRCLSNVMRNQSLRSSAADPRADYAVRVLSRNHVPMLIADRDQARYFHELRGRKRAELHERIDKLHVELTRLDRVHDKRAVRSQRRIISELESEVHSIDRMLKTLRNRLLEQPPDRA
jgi:hypothetical protein